MKVEFSTEKLLVNARMAPITLHWSFPGCSMSMGYSSMQVAWENFQRLKDSASVTHASIWENGECLHRHDYDPYAWHDVRLIVGR